MTDELDDQIAEDAAGPESATVDGVTVTKRSLQDLIEADRYLAGKRAVHPSYALKRARLVPPGAT